MAIEITMPQQSDTMTEGTVVKWRKKEGDKVKAGEVIAEIETDKAVMEMESFESGTLAAILVKEGGKAAVGATLAVLATAKENAADVKKQYAAGAAAASAASKPATPGASSAKPQPAKAPAGKPGPSAATPATAPKSPTSGGGMKFTYDIIVIGGGPAGYAAAIRAGQLGKRVLCVEKENLGGTCLNWGCIPTKALLEDGAFVRQIRTEANDRGVFVENIKVDFAKIIGRSRGITRKLQAGIASLFQKYKVKQEFGLGQVLGPHRVRVTTNSGSNEYTTDHIIIAVGARATELPFAKFDGKTVITARDAMILPTQPKRMAIIGAGAIGCEFADFYNAIGTEVTIVEMLPRILPNEDEDVSIMLERIFVRRGVKLHTRTRTDKIEKTPSGMKLTLSGDRPGTIETDVVLVAVGVTGNTDGLAAPDAGLKVDRNRVIVDREYRTNLENVWAVGDCIWMHFDAQEAMGDYRHPDLAHVAHHEAVHVVEQIVGGHNGNPIDYRNIPGCTYTHPQVASMGGTEKKLREQGRKIRVGKFPFSVSGRALAAGETEGFVKLIFGQEYGELLGVHMIGENVTEMLAELVLAKKLEATEAEIIDAIHPHSTMSEAVMEAAGQAVSRAIHI